MHKDAIDIWIDADTTDISDAIARNFTKWDDFIGQSIWIEPSPIPQSYAEEISTMKDWISNRVDWMDANLLGDCSLDTPVSINENVNQLSIFPNPASDIIWVKSEESGIMNIYSIQGKLIISTNISKGKQAIPISNFPRGLYQFELLAETGSRSISSIIIK